MMVVIDEFELRKGAESGFEAALKHMQVQVKQYDSRKGRTNDSPVLFAKLVGVEMQTIAGEMIATFEPSDFPTAGEAIIAQNAKKEAKQRSAERAREQAAQDQAIALEKSRHERNTTEKRFRQCSALTD